jgi:hypothetical protein
MGRNLRGLFSDPAKETNRVGVQALLGLSLDEPFQVFDFFSTSQTRGFRTSQQAKSTKGKDNSAALSWGEPEFL